MREPCIEPFVFERADDDVAQRGVVLDNEDERAFAARRRLYADLLGELLGIRTTMCRRRISMISRRSRSPSTRFTDTRDAPMNAASSSCVSVSSSFASPSCCARSRRYFATRLGTSRKMRSSTRSDSRADGLCERIQHYTRTDCGCDFEEREEVVPREQRCARVLHRRGGRGAWASIEERELAEEVTFPHDRDERLLSELARQRDLHRAVEDDVEVRPGIVLSKQRLAALERSGARPLRER